MELLSIIVPVYNACKTIRQCLENIVSITYENREAIFVDDGSTDESGAILDEYSKKYEYIKVFHIKNSGCQIARQVALENMKGKYIAFLDADDGVDYNAYSECISLLEKKQCDFVAFDYMNEYFEFTPSHNTENTRYIEYNKNEIIDHFQRYDDVSFEGFLWNKVWTRELLEGIRFEDDLFLCSDVVYVWQALKKAQKACYIPIKYYHYLYSESSITKSSNLMKFKKAIKAWTFVKDEIVKYETPSVKKVCGSFVIWNVKALEHIENAKLSSGNEDYLTFTENIRKYKECISYISLYYRILAYSALKSGRLFLLADTCIIFTKQIYQSIQKRKRSSHLR